MSQILFRFFYSNTKLIACLTVLNLLIVLISQNTNAEVTGRFVDFDSSGGPKLSSAHEWKGKWDEVISTSDSRTNLLLFYDRTKGHGKVFSYNAKGEILPLLDEKGWSTSWDAIVGGKFGPANVVFYKRGTKSGDTGLLRAYRFSSNGQKQLRFEQTIEDPYGEESSGVGWDIVIGGYWGGTSEGLLFYNRTEGRAIFMRYNRLKKMFEKAKSYTDWGRSWDEIASGRFGDDIIDDIVVHDQDTGETKIVEFNDKLNIERQIPLNTTDGIGTSHGARLAAGHFAGLGKEDIVLYQQGVVSTGQRGQPDGNDKGRYTIWKDDRDGSYAANSTVTSWAADWTHVLPVHGEVSRGLLLYKSLVPVTVELIRTRHSVANSLEEWSAVDSNSLDIWEAALKRTFRNAGIRFTVIRRPGTLKHDLFNSYICGANEDSDLNREKANAWVKQNVAGNRIAVFARPNGRGCSSRKANFVIAGGGDSLANPKHLAHEIGHFLGLPHSFVNAENPEELKEKLNAIETKNKRDPRISDLDADRINAGNFLKIRDTPPVLNAKYFTNQKLEACQQGDRVVMKTSIGTSVSIPRDTHNVMAYINCDNLFRISKDQVRAVRLDLHTNRQRLLASSIAVILLPGRN